MGPERSNPARVYIHRVVVFIKEEKIVLLAPKCWSHRLEKKSFWIVASKSTTAKGSYVEGRIRAAMQLTETYSVTCAFEESSFENIS
jgi:hypothetical protein